MTYDQAIESLEAGTPSKEALELAADALAFVQGLHQMFSENGMTSSENPTLLGYFYRTIKHPEAHCEVSISSRFLAQPHPIRRRLFPSYLYLSIF